MSSFGSFYASVLCNHGPIASSSRRAIAKFPLEISSAFFVEKKAVCSFYGILATEETL
jgi:hypothetical protein